MNALLVLPILIPLVVAAGSLLDLPASAIQP